MDVQGFQLFIMCMTLRENWLQLLTVHDHLHKKKSCYLLLQIWIITGIKTLKQNAKMVETLIS